MKNEILLKRTYQIRKDQDEKLKKLKEKTGESESHYLREALDKYFERKDKK